jgi:Family of unknown function (DUF6188)
MDSKPQIDAAFIGLRCTNVTRFGAEAWRFEFEGRTTLDVRCPWRIITDGGIALGNADHEQQFGLPKPVDAKLEAERLLLARVANVTLRERTADLVLELEGGTSLEVFNSSSGYEGWECTSTDGLLAVAMGGGELSVWKTDPPLASGSR